ASDDGSLVLMTVSSGSSRRPSPVLRPALSPPESSPGAPPASSPPAHGVIRVHPRGAGAREFRCRSQPVPVPFSSWVSTPPPSGYAAADGADPPHHPLDDLAPLPAPAGRPVPHHPRSPRASSPSRSP